MMDESTTAHPNRKSRVLEGGSVPRYPKKTAAGRSTATPRAPTTYFGCDVLSFFASHDDQEGRDDVEPGDDAERCAEMHDAPSVETAATTDSESDESQDRRAGPGQQSRPRALLAEDDCGRRPRRPGRAADDSAIGTFPVLYHSSSDAEQFSRMSEALVRSAALATSGAGCLVPTPAAQRGVVLAPSASLQPALTQKVATTGLATGDGAARRDLHRIATETTRVEGAHPPSDRDDGAPGRDGGGAADGREENGFFGVLAELLAGKRDWGTGGGA